uniref:Tetraspanin n=1 Tax=Ciona savignyi TaxID=51511 RepID=H2YQ92_CIOSA
MGKRLFNYLVVTFNLLSFLFGAAVLGLGIWASIQSGGLRNIVDEVMFAGIYILIACGALVMLLAFFGCYASVAESKPAIVVYCTALLVAVGLEVVGCVILFAYYDASRNRLTDSYSTKYGIDDKVTKIWDDAQIKGKCCGREYPSDWDSSFYYRANKTYPDSCCVRNDSADILDLVRCYNGEHEFIYTQGCEGLLKLYYYAIAGTTIPAVMFQLISVAIIACLYQHIY